MTAYIVAQVDVTDRETYTRYTDRTPALVARHGGRFLTRGTPVAALEGPAFDGRMVILEFPSLAAIEAFYADPDYAEARAFRTAASSGRFLVQEGVADNANPPASV